MELEYSGFGLRWMNTCKLVVNKKSWLLKCGDMPVMYHTDVSYIKRLLEVLRKDGDKINGLVDRYDRGTITLVEPDNTLKISVGKSCGSFQYTIFKGEKQVEVFRDLDTLEKSLLGVIELAENVRESITDYKQ